MAQVYLKGNPVETVGELPAVGTQAPDFTLTKTDLSNVRLNDFIGQSVVLNIFPSIDTPVCAMSVRRFNKEADNLENTTILCISADLPFSHERFCEIEELDDVMALSVFRSPEFGRDYGVTISSGPLTGLLSRAIVIIDPAGKIIYTEQVQEISQQPNYEKALQALRELAG